MKIGIFTDTYSPDINGVAISISLTEKTLKKLGDEIFVVAPNNKFEYLADPERKIWRLPSVRFYGEKRYRVAAPALFKKEISALSLDIIHTHTPFLVGIIGLRLAKKKNIPAVHTYHTRYQEYSHYVAPDWITRIITQPMIRAIVSFLNHHQAVIAPSLGIKKELEKFGVKVPIEVIPTGADIENLQNLSSKEDPLPFLKGLGINEEDELIIFTSRIAKEKNIEFIFRAVKIVFEQRPQAKLLIIGDGNEKINLENLVKKMGLEDRIIFSGFMAHDKIFPIYRKAKVFVFASHTETQGVAVLEALALGLPVVALEATGIDDLLNDNRGGFLIKGEDERAFSKKVIDLLSDDALYSQKVEEAKLQGQNFSVEKTGFLMNSLFKRVISNYESAT